LGRASQLLGSREDSNGGVKIFQQKILRVGAQTKIFDGKFLVEGESLLPNTVFLRFLLGAFFV
jgi:hypothetical protein